MNYQDFLDSKSQLGGDYGFEPVDLPEWLFPFQHDVVSWATRKGRDALFGDCGMGKTPMQLVWADQVAHRMNKPVLLLTPLAVGGQTLGEAEKFAIEAHRSRDGKPKPNITIANYEKLHLFNRHDFSGVVCDESSILKNFDGTTKATVTEFMREMPHRLLCTATAAPNDYVELGTSSEALGYLGHMDMLTAFFRNQQNNSSHRTSRSRWGDPRFSGGTREMWRFKYHAEQPFWRWVASWARAFRRPSDLGYSDDGFILPPLTERETIVPCSRPLDGKLFVEAAVSLQEQREERRMTLAPRCEEIARLVDHDRPALVWCHLNDEGDLLEKLIPGAVQVSGSQTDEQKEELLTAFTSGQARVLVSKPKVAGFGLNMQHCSHVTFFPSHSYEQYYQGVRRCWRFGQTQPVTVDIVTTEGELNVLKNLQRKAANADRMFTELVAHMNDALHMRGSDPYQQEVSVPTWL
jgi:hypothetical protein